MRSKRPRRHKSCQVRRQRATIARLNESWSMDFTADQLFDGRRFRLLTLVDNFSRESLAIRVGQRLTGNDVVGTLEEVVRRCGHKPATIRVDNGPEFISKSLDFWAYWNGVQLDFSRPGKPTDNAFIESFNGKLRGECLNQHWFLSLDDAQEVVEAWREDYNRNRPHSALGDRSPIEFASFLAGASPAKKPRCSCIPSGSNLGARSRRGPRSHTLAALRCIALLLSAQVAG